MFCMCVFIHSLKLNVRTFDERKKKVHHFHAQSGKKEGPESDPIATPCTTPLGYETKTSSNLQR